MSPARLLQYFDRLTEAPDAVPRLRQFVLDLAVRGKLVEQNPEDEPAAELIEQIQAEKEQLIKEGKIRRRTALPLIEQDEIRFGLPMTWRWARLADLLTKLTDGTHHSPPNTEKGDFKYVTAKNIKPEGVSLDEMTYVSKDVHAEIYARCDPVKGDVLYIKDGATTGIVTVNDLNEPFSMLSSVALLKLPQAVYNQLLVYFLRSPFFYSQMRGFMKGAAITRVTLTRMAPALIPLPPLAEQHRIVATVDEMMALCDELEAAQAKRERRRDRLVAATLHGLNNGDQGAEPGTHLAFESSARFYFNHLPRLTTRPEHIHQLRQTILNLAVRGRLVEQLPLEGTADSAIDDIDRERGRLVAEGKLGRQLTTPPVEEEQTPFAIPSAWRWVRFGNITFCRDGERIPVSREERQHRLGAYDYYGASGVIDKIDAFLFDKPLLLIGEDGANLINRSTPIAFIARGKYWVNNHAHVLDGISERLLRYLELFINAIDLRAYVTGTAQPKMNQAKMNSIPVALPPLAEQNRIVAKVDELMALCDDLEARLITAATARRQLLEATLHEALEGGS